MHYIKGDVVEIEFPYTDLSSSKFRPALIISNVLGVNYIFMQISSNVKKSNFRIHIENSDFIQGKLYLPSCAHIDILFTGEKTIINKKYGHINSNKLNQIINSLKSLL